MAMNITLVVDQKYSYIEALRIAYDKAVRDGEMDEQTEASCLYEFSKTSPAAVYHESDMVSDVTSAPDGGVYFKSWGLREFYEQARINARRCVAESLSDELGSEASELLDEWRTGNSDVPQNGWSFSVDEAGSLEVVSPAGTLTSDQIDVLTRLLNQSEFIRRLALDYAQVVASLANCTLEGLSAPYARYFSTSSTVR